MVSYKIVLQMHFQERCSENPASRYYGTPKILITGNWNATSMKNKFCWR
jgi:hypothetical protein